MMKSKNIFQILLVSWLILVATGCSFGPFRCTVWNANPGSDLSACDFSGKDLSGRDLSGAILTDANLHGTNLSKAHLSGISLIRANLSDANLENADLKDANLSGADLTNAVLDGSVLVNANLSRTNLAGRDFSGVDLSGVNFTGADLTGADLSSADLTSAVLDGAVLMNADLSQTNLAGRDFSGVNLSGANLSGANLIGANLSSTNLTRANLKGADLSGANLTDAILNESTLVNANLSQTNLAGRDFSDVDLSGANLAGANLSNVNFRNANLTTASLAGADLTNAKLVGAVLRRTILKNANLSGADLSGQDFSEMDLSGVNFTGADLTGCNLSAVDLSKAVLDQAVLVGVNLSRADLAGRDFHGSNLSEANLAGVNLANANLNRVNLSRANLRGADLSSADLIGADLSRADLSQTNLRAANLSEANLSGAILDEAILYDAAGITDAMLSQVASLRKAQFDPPQTIYETASGVCEGQSVERAAAYKGGGGLHPIVAFEDFGGYYSAHSIQDKIPSEWLPPGVRFLELVACISHQQRIIEVCGPYYYPSGERASDITRYRHQVRVRLLTAQTGRLVAERTFYGSYPRACEQTERAGTIAIYGSSVAPADVINWLKGYVSVPLLSLDETFDNNLRDWDLGDFSGNWGAGDAQIRGGKFVVTVTQSRGMAWRWWPSDTMSDFRATLEGRLATGDPEKARYGIAFRDDGESFYLFEVDETGYYTLLFHNSQQWQTLIDWTPSDAISRFKPNILAVEAQGEQIRLFINGQLVNEIRDSRLQEGHISIVIDIDSGETATYEFDNYRLYLLP
jgi:uncharacterized protein YjbI with pentapeptide repeats